MTKSMNHYIEQSIHNDGHTSGLKVTDPVHCLFWFMTNWITGTATSHLQQVGTISQLCDVLRNGGCRSTENASRLGPAWAEEVIRRLPPSGFTPPFLLTNTWSVHLVSFSIIFVTSSTVRSLDKNNPLFSYISFHHWGKSSTSLFTRSAVFFEKTACPAAKNLECSKYWVASLRSHELLVWRTGTYGRKMYDRLYWSWHVDWKTLERWLMVV